MGILILSLAAKAAVALGAFKEGWNGFSILHTAAARAGGLDLGFVPGQGGLDAKSMAKPAGSMFSICLAPMRSRWNRGLS